MNEAVLSAIQDRKEWLARFTRTEYEQAFHEYCNQCGEVFRGVIREADKDPAALIESMLDSVSEGWKREAFWRRTTRRFEEKQMVFLYLTPMLLEMGEEAFAQSLREAWRKRWPKDGYEVVTWKQIKRGFRLTIMGFEVGNRQEDED